MPKLYFRYGPMNSSKTANLLMVAHNYRSQGKKVILIKPEIDCRFGLKTITSRAVGEIDADIILSPECECINLPVDTDCILVDEAQFLSVKNVEMLRKLTPDVPVICYGLKTDYMSQLFTGSKRLLELADTIEEIKTICVNCNKKAIVNAKFHVINNEKFIIKKGKTIIDLGAEEKYQPMCWSCWNDSKTHLQLPTYWEDVLYKLQCLEKGWDDLDAIPVIPIALENTRTLLFELYTKVPDSVNNVCIGATKSGWIDITWGSTFVTVTDDIIFMNYSPGYKTMEFTLEEAIKNIK